MRTNSQTMATKTLARQRALQAFALRQAGLKYHEIAQELGYGSPNSAYAAVKRIMDALPKEASTEALTIQKARLDQLLAGLWNQAIHGDLGAVNAALRIMEQQTALNGGVTSMIAMSHEHTHQVKQDGVLSIGGDKDDFIRRLQAMAGYTDDEQGNQVIFDVEVKETETKTPGQQAAEQAVAKGELMAGTLQEPEAGDYWEAEIVEPAQEPDIRWMDEEPPSPQGPPEGRVTPPKGNHGAQVKKKARKAAETPPGPVSI